MNRSEQRPPASTEAAGRLAADVIQRVKRRQAQAARLVLNEASKQQPKKATERDGPPWQTNACT
jgi:hypothetical protein